MTHDESAKIHRGRRAVASACSTSQLSCTLRLYRFFTEHQFFFMHNLTISTSSSCNGLSGGQQLSLLLQSDAGKQLRPLRYLLHCLSTAAWCLVRSVLSLSACSNRAPSSRTRISSTSISFASSISITRASSCSLQPQISNKAPQLPATTCVSGADDSLVKGSTLGWYRCVLKAYRFALKVRSVFNCCIALCSFLCPTYSIDSTLIYIIMRTQPIK
ncbi:unnamed protein product [Protopolystoma xenopodis]|uniref:Uncharacterized protein n=1 Tax=Protopolystoma xenopodis TaxID=117903 RepID=A0A448WJN0_9PLAT|nr:unnamed protein product [Protopolystoma xenopodis]